MEKNFKLKKIHMTGVGGISMSSIAEYLIKRGFSVSGSDIKANELTSALVLKGMRFYLGHDAKNVRGADVVVYNSAIKPDNCEIVYAKELGIPVFCRMEFISLLAEEFKIKAGIAGCHGKTTCTGMVANVLKNANKSFYAHIGGNVIPFGNCLYTGKEIFLSEICEYKKNTDLFTADIAAVTNIGFDHPDCYKDKNDISRTYRSFLKRGKISVINADDEIMKSFKGDFLTFGIERGSVRAKKIEETKGGISFDLVSEGKTRRVSLRVHGRYNVYNALCSFCVCKALGVDEDVIVSGLNDFGGVRRRFEKVGSIEGVPVICDYAHHPEEIKNSLKTAKEIYGENIAAVFQPHTYSRTKALLCEFVRSFEGCKSLCVYKTFPARETFDEEGDAIRICEKIEGARYACDEIQLEKYLREAAEKGVSLILALGAGDIYDITVKLTSDKD